MTSWGGRRFRSKPKPWRGELGKPRGYPNHGERCGASWEDGAARQGAWVGLDSFCPV